MESMACVTSADMLPVDEDIGDCSLTSHLSQCILDLFSIRLDIQFVETKGLLKSAEEFFGLCAVWTISFGKDHDLVLLD